MITETITFTFADEGQQRRFHDRLSASEDALLAALKGLVALHTEPAGITAEIVLGDEFEAHLDAVEERTREAIKAARSAIAAATRSET